MIKELKDNEVIAVHMLTPWNAHAHLRQDEMLSDIISFSSPYPYVVCMGNTVPFITTGKEGVDYEKQILGQKPKFKPIMTIMLVNDTDGQTLYDARKKGIRIVKLISAGTSTNSKDGVALTDLKSKREEFAVMEELEMIFSVHCELLYDPKTGRQIHPLYREEMGTPYIAEIISRFPNLKIVFEHCSTARLIEFVQKTRGGVAGTLTVHHATHNYEMGLYKNGKVKNPFFHCLPCLKHRDDMLAVRDTMVVGHGRFFLGTDDAPHYIHKKKSPNPPGGISTPGIVAIPKLVQIFEEAETLENLEHFAVLNGAGFYGLNLHNWPMIKVVRKNWTVAESYNDIVPLFAGKTLPWQIKTKSINLLY